jgi:hypothetical protein
MHQNGLRMLKKLYSKDAQNGLSKHQKKENDKEIISFPIPMTTLDSQVRNSKT